MNRADVVLLNNSLDQLGNSLLQRQVMAQRNTEIANQKADRAAQRDLQSQQLDVANQRYGAQEAHYNRMESTQQDAAKMAQQNAAKQEKGQLLGQILQLNQTGQLQDLDSVNDFLANDEHFGPTGIQLVKPPTKPDPQAGQNAVAQALQQADQWRKKAAAAQDSPDDAERYNDYADKLEQWSDAQANPPAKPAPDAFQDVTTEEQPGGIGTPKTTVKRKVPTGQPVAKTLDPATARQFLQQAGGDKAKARALAKQAGYSF